MFEVNEKNNEEVRKKYAKEIKELDQYISEKIQEQGRKEIFFSTGYNTILNFIKNKDATVMICQDNNKKVISSCYIVQREELYRYNDLTKFFKFNKDYIEYSKLKYDTKELYSIEYETYMKKIEGYKYAKELIAKELNVTDLVGYCKIEKDKGDFDEQNKVRVSVNRYIADYFKDNNKDRIGLIELDRFYLLKFSDLQNCEDDEIKAKCNNETEENKILYKEYDELVDLLNLCDSLLPDEKDFKYLKPENYKKYFGANIFNTIELDTYIVHPDYRSKGLGKIIIFEGLKIQIKKLLEKRPNLEEIFVCSTIHQDNYPSKKVTHSLGEFDVIYIKRKYGINREVHFCKIERKNLDEFIKNNEKRINILKEKLEKEYNIILKNIELK